MATLSNPFLATLKTDRREGIKVYDDKLPGFAAMVYPSGQITFCIRYGSRTSRRWKTLGKLGVVTLAQARKKAKEFLSQASLGGDPVREAERLQEIPTFSAWKKSYLEEITAKRKSHGTIKYYLSQAELKLGKYRLDQIQPTQIAELQQWKRSTPILANRMVATLSACFTIAIRRDVISRNPCRSVEAFPENPPRDRTFSVEELQRLVAALNAEQDPYVKAAFTLCLETGCRQGEVLAAKWEDFDLVGMRWRLPSPKAGRPQLIFLHESTVQWLKELPRSEESPYVIVGEAGDGRRFDLKKAWRRIKERANLTGLTAHDIRRTYGKLVSRESGLHAASKALRHHDVSLTAKVYAPMHEAEVREAVGKVLPFVRGAA